MSHKQKNVNAGSQNSEHYSPLLWPNKPARGRVGGGAGGVRGGIKGNGNESNRFLWSTPNQRQLTARPFQLESPWKYIYKCSNPPFFLFLVLKIRELTYSEYIRMQLPDVMGDVMLWADIRLVGNGLNTILLMTSTLRHHPLQWGSLIKCSCTIRIIFARNIIAREIEN